MSMNPMKTFHLLFTLLGFAITSTSFAQSTNTPSSGIAVENGQKVAFLGDSITANGFTNPSGFINLVISGLNTCGLKVTPIPAGGSGNNSKNLLSRIDKDVISKKPDWVAISCGINDVSYPQNACALDPFKTNMTAMVDQCQSAGIKVMLLTATVFGEDPTNPKDQQNNQKLIAYNDFIRTLAKEKNCLLADMNALMQGALKSLRAVQGTSSGSTPPPKRLTVDGLHMSPIGNEMMASGILTAFGFTDSQIKAARETWADMPNAMELGKMELGKGLVVSMRQYKALDAKAAKRDQSVNEMVNAAVAKTLDDLIKDAKPDK